jgi:hypothetical protein
MKVLLEITSVSVILVEIGYKEQIRHVKPWETYITRVASLAVVVAEL